MLQLIKIQSSWRFKYITMQHKWKQTSDACKWQALCFSCDLLCTLWMIHFPSINLKLFFYKIYPLSFFLFVLNKNSKNPLCFFSNMVITSANTGAKVGGDFLCLDWIYCTFEVYLYSYHNPSACTSRWLWCMGGIVRDQTLLFLVSSIRLV